MLSIIIPAFNAEKTLEGLLASIQRSDYKDYEVIVVDDCSSDGTASIIKEQEVKGVSLPAHSGPAAARNKGAEMAKGGILVFLDSDIEVELDTLGKIAARFRDNPQIKVLVGTYSEQPLNSGYFPRFKALWFRSLFIDTSTHTDSLEGFCTAIDKDVFHFLGGFNPLYQKSGIEDYELGCRLGQKYPLYFDSSIQVRHHFPGFLENLSLFFRRAYDFIPLFLSQRYTSRGKTLDRDGLASIFSLTSFLLLPFLPSGSLPVFALFLLSLAAFIFFSFRFLKLVFLREGALFTIAAIFTHYANGIVVGLAIILGILRYMLKSIRS